MYNTFSVIILDDDCDNNRVGLLKLMMQCFDKQSSNDGALHFPVSINFDGVFVVACAHHD